MATRNADLKNFIDVGTIFNEIKFKIIKLADAKKYQTEFEPKLSYIRKGDKRSEKKENEIKNITLWIIFE